MNLGELITRNARRPGDRGVEGTEGTRGGRADARRSSVGRRVCQTGRA